jgi:hypothetical protein
MNCEDGTHYNPAAKSPTATAPLKRSAKDSYSKTRPAKTPDKWVLPGTAWLDIQSLAVILLQPALKRLRNKLRTVVTPQIIRSPALREQGPQTLDNLARINAPIFLTAKPSGRQCPLPVEQRSTSTASSPTPNDASSASPIMTNRHTCSATRISVVKGLLRNTVNTANLNHTLAGLNLQDLLFFIITHLVTFLDCHTNILSGSFFGERSATASSLATKAIN